jgi:hypothetical protein
MVAACFAVVSSFHFFDRMFLRYRISGGQRIVVMSVLASSFKARAGSDRIFPAVKWENRLVSVLRYTSWCVHAGKGHLRRKHVAVSSDGGVDVLLQDHILWMFGLIQPHF